MRFLSVDAVTTIKYLLYNYHIHIIIIYVTITKETKTGNYVYEGRMATQDNKLSSEISLIL